jgi:hypothetical protein
MPAARRRHPCGGQPHALAEWAVAVGDTRRPAGTIDHKCALDDDAELGATTMMGR